MFYYAGLTINDQTLFLFYGKVNNMPRNQRQAKCAALTPNLRLAEKFNTAEEAENAISVIDNGYRVYKPYMIPIRSDGIGSQSKKLRELNEDDYHSETINGLVDDLSKKLEKCNLECMDLQHYMEFRELDIQGGYKAYKMMHDARKRRRKIKDELLLLENIKKAIIGTEDSMKARDYRPRVRNDIQYFKDKPHKIGKESEQTIQASNSMSNSIKIKLLPIYSWLQSIELKLK